MAGSSLQMEKISQGAGAVIYKEGNFIIKERIVKGYRVPEIDDSLRKFRTRREAKIIDKLNEIGICAPKLISMCDKDMKIKMEFIEGIKLRDCLTVKSAYMIGKTLAQMHINDIIHGDLTTSNMILNKDKLVFIDFGLSFFSSKDEDKAVDLHLLDRALASKHNDIYEKSFAEAVRGYSENYPGSKTVLKRLEQVEQRGRNKGKF